ncbi:Mov34-domain-containing protein [Dichomitus squalens]|nr:Mov34-domain-containing protein [Dichomitus squalens]
MPLGPPSSAVFIQNTAPGFISTPGRPPTSVTVHPVALFSILDHYLRRTDAQERVIGTLLGTRSDNGEVEVRSAFAVLHSETEVQVAVDMEYHRTMYDLHHKVNPKEVIVGWYSTGSNLNTYSALIQNFYSQETAPHQAIHLALNTGVEEGQKAGVQAYVGSPVGVNPKPENCVFVPIPCELRFNDAERSGLDLLTSNLSDSVNATFTNPSSDLELLERSLVSVYEMLDRVLSYVQSVLSGEVKGDAAIGRYLMDALGPSTEDLERGEFNSHLQVRFLSHLTIRGGTQLTRLDPNRIPSLYRTWRTSYGHKRRCRRAWP